jgi:hypothetical protein
VAEGSDKAVSKTARPEHRRPQREGTGMTVKREYRCNLCGDTIKDSTAGIGIKWASDTTEGTLVSDSEHHMCSPCCRRLREMFDRLGREDLARPQWKE